MVKKTQNIMIWFLPLIVIGGLFFPLLGYLVVAMMVTLLTMSFIKKGRYWCWNLCPRGSFLDIVLSKYSKKKPMPEFCLKKPFRWSIVIVLMGFLLIRLIQSGGNLIIIGSIFVSMCLATTIIAIVLGLYWKHRAWCMICPMGTLQEVIGKKCSKPDEE